jgi:hypothetical protein
MVVVLVGVDVGVQSVAKGEFGEMSKSDTLRVLAASHVILAVVLIGMTLIEVNIGVLLLQGGQWYAEFAAFRELREIEAKELEDAKKSQ